ncbi:MAG: zinc-binding alcohol dehydrogenase family protein [Bacteroidota bacterium]|nr:zinc-binding alcohol dehydrogenase family protein [Bacteroidota bacterium]MDP4214997.1 zinc-binding alcohol dehydrogenase family protein [Bacteroidota bacterium]MDP4244256.1 zinc-binding alcohol dehydrogenase family protein [Bacteroidota bacterium]MDP4256997.1 zinc-binding alcohol dehydrogenase family protein [Bacteroidota bacterium]
MRSLICTRPGEMEYREMNAPLAQQGQAILKVRRIGICGTDLHAYEGTQPYFEYPRILGHELAGDIVDLDGAPGFMPGETVTVIPYFHCGHCIACRSGKPNCCVNIKVCGVHIDGGMVDYLSVPSSSLVHGGGLTIDELALVEPLAIGAHAVARAGVGEGEFVLVAGAGPIGLGIMASARIAGGEVIALDTNADRLAFCRDHLDILHTIQVGTAGEPVKARLAEITRGDMPSVIFDATGNLRAIRDAFSWLAHGGRYVLVGLQKEEIAFSHPEFHKREATLMSSRNATRADFEGVIGLIGRKEIDPAAFVTHRVPFGKVKRDFPGWLDPSAGVIKAMINMEDAS